MLRGFQSYFSSKVGTGLIRSSWAATLTFVVALLMAALPLGAAAQTNIGSVALGSSIASTSVQVTIPAPGSVSSVAVLTAGSPNLDFTLVSAGNTCTGTVTTSCTVNVKFSPKYAGARNGAVVVYSSTAVLGTAYITGTGTGPQINFPSPLPSATNITGPTVEGLDLAVDGAGYVYSADGSGNLYKTAPVVNATTGQVTYPSGTPIYTTTGYQLHSVAVDGAGNVYLVAADSVYQLTLLANGNYAAPAQIGSSWPGPNDVAVDGAGNLYVTNSAYSSGNPIGYGVYKLTLTNSGYSAPVALTAPSGGWSFPANIAVDGSENVYVIDINAGNVYKLVLSGGSYAAPVVIASTNAANSSNGVGAPNGVAVDGNGNVYISDYDDGILLLTPSGSGYTEQAVASIEYALYSVGVDGAGNVYFGSDGYGGTDILGVYPLATPPALNLGSVVIGSSTVKAVRVQNIGNAALDFSEISFPADFPEVLGRASECSLTPLPVAGNCTLTVSFAPIVASLSDTQPLTGNVTLDSNATPATQAIPVSGTAIQATATVTLSTPTNPSTQGSPVTFTATVTGVTGIVAPAGTVAFKSGSVTITGCATAPITSGVAICTTSALVVGADTITANYSGDTAYMAPANPATFTETVVTAPDASAPAEWTNLGTATASSPATASVTFTFSSAVTLGAINVLTGGAPGLDFSPTSPQGAGACAINTPYAANAACKVYVTFSPKFAGPRYGAVVLTDNASPANVAATEYLVATGNAAQDIFMPGVFSNALNGATNFGGPEGIAVDGSGNVYVADAGNTVVDKMTLSGGVYSAATPLASANSTPLAFGYPTGVAVDGAGNVYVADSGGGSVAPSVFLLAHQPGGGYIQTALGSGWIYPSSVAVDGDGNVFVADDGDNPGAGFVAELTPSNGSYTQTMLAGTLMNPWGIAVDAGDNVYLAVNENYDDRAPGSVVKLTKTGSNYIPSSLGGGWLDPEYIAVDGNGNVYVTDDGGNLGSGYVAKLTLQSSVSYIQSTLFTSICDTEQGFCPVTPGNFTPEGIALDGAGNIYVTNYAFLSAYKLDVADPPEGANQLQFEETSIGWTSTDSPKTITVENFGNQSLNFTALSYPADFPELTPNPSGVCTGSTQLAANGACTLPIDFTPIASLGALTSQSLTESVSLTTNTISATGAQVIDVAGYELAPTAQMTALTASPSPTWVGNSVTITATVAIPSGQTPAVSGNVEFSFGGSDISGCSAVPLTSGVASCTTSALPAGNDEIYAIYTGNYPTAGIVVYELVTATAPPTGNFGNTNIGSANVGSTMTGNTVTITFDTGETLGGIEVLTEGVPNLDFTSSQSGTCLVPELRSGARPMAGPNSGGACTCGDVYQAGDTCTVNVNFSPKYAGPRYGAVVLTNQSNSTILGTGYLQGNGVGAQTVFAVPIYVQTNDCCAVPGTKKGSKAALAPAAMPGLLLPEDEQIAWLPGFQGSIGAPSFLTGGWNTPYGIAVDGANNIYIADGADQVVVKETYAKTAGVVSYTASSLNPPSGNWGNPAGVAVDGAGNVYVADPGNGNVVMETLQPNGSYVASAIGTNWYSPTGIAVDGSGKVYVADAGGSVTIETPTGGTYVVSYLPYEFDCPSGVAVDGAGNVFVTDPCNGNGGTEVYEFVLQPTGYYNSGNPISIGGTIWSYPIGIAVDDNDNVYVADPGMGEVVLETLSDGNYIPTQIGQFYAPYELALTPAGNLLVADNGSNEGGLGLYNNDAVKGGHRRAAAARSPGSARPASILNGGTTTSSSTPSVYFLDFADPPQIGFATTGYGSTSTDSPQTVIVDEFGNKPLGFYSISGTPFYPADFPEFPGMPDDCVVGVWVVTNSACTLTIDFTPSTPNLTGAPLLLQEDLAIITNAWNSAPQVGELEFKQLLQVSGTELSTVATPTFLPISGTTSSTPLTVYINDVTAGAAIYYTIGSATPTSSSTLYTSAGITVSASETINAIAVLAGDTTSAVASANYFITSSPGGGVNFTITMQAPTTATVVPGSAAVFNLTVTPTQAVPGDTATHAGEAAPLGTITFPSNVNLSYTSAPALPTGWTLVFSPNPVLSGSGATSVTMTIQTALTTASSKPGGALASRLAPFSLALLLLPFAGWMRKSGKRFSRMISLLLLLGAGAAAVAGVCGCNNVGFFGQAPQTYTVTVTGTMNGLSNNANTNVTLTVE